MRASRVIVSRTNIGWLSGLPGTRRRLLDVMIVRSTFRRAQCIKDFGMGEGHGQDEFDSCLKTRVVAKS